MTSVLHQLGRPALVSLARALEAQRMKRSFSKARLRHHVPAELVEPVRAELEGMVEDGMQQAHIARLLHLLADERERSRPSSTP